MTLGELLRGMAGRVRGSSSIDIADIAIHSQKVTPASLFVAVHGIALDGHDFLPEAAERGAAALVVEDESRVPAEFKGTVVAVSSARAALNHIASRFFGDPGNALFCVGITGTDGKSTVAWMVEAVLNGCGTPTAVIGTVDHHFVDGHSRHAWPGATTPPPLAMQERLAQLHALGAQAVALEATSQGLSQSRISGVPLDVALFTNLAHDHLDYHGHVDAYFEAKDRLFSEVLAATPKTPCHAIINIDTPFGARIRVPKKATRTTYGAWDTGADVRYQVRESALAGSVIQLAYAEQKPIDLRLPMLGAFNAANAAGAVAVGLAAGHDFGVCVGALGTFTGVPGRAQRVGHFASQIVFVDYAHDPQAFDELLPTVKEAMSHERPGAQLITVFGCGGDRDRAKRPLMLQSALRSSDKVIITMDNPRSEEPEGITREIMFGVRSADEERLLVHLDRKLAIEAAVAMARDRDVIMILGKGHERYQIIGRDSLPYDGDDVIAEACLQGRAQ